MLEMIAYKNVRRVYPGVDFEVDEDGDVVDFSLNITDIRIPNSHPIFALRAPGLVDGGYYLYSDAEGMDHGFGYSNWHAFLREIKELSGYTGAESDPFHELIAFSDCEGTIGADASRRIAKAFADFDHKASPPERRPSFYSRYEAVRRLFDCAADDGFVSFF